MRIVGELNKAELNVGGKGVGFDPSSQAPSFEDILNLISVGENVQGKGSEIPFDPAVPPEGSLEVQGQGKEAPTTGKGQKSNDFPINLSIFGLVAYGQIKQILEEEYAKADNVLTRTDIDLSTEEKTNTSLIQFKSLEEQSQNTLTKLFTEANKEEKIGNNEFLADFIVKPVEGRNTQVSNLFNVGKEYTQVEVPNTNKINTAQFFAKTSYQTIESPILSTDQNPQNLLNINQTNVGDGLKNDNVEPLPSSVLINDLSKTKDLKPFSYGFDSKAENTQKTTNIEQLYDAPSSENSYTNVVETSIVKNAKLEIKDKPQTKEFAQGFFDSSELEFYPKEENTKADLQNNPAPISVKIAKNVLEDLSQKAEKSELLPAEKGKREEEHSHLYNTGVSHQRFEDKIENVQEVKNTKPFHTFHETRSLYVKLEEGDFRIRAIKDALSVKVDFREDFRPPTVQEVQNLIESLSKVGFRMEMLSLNGKNLQWEFRQGQEDRRGNRSREVSPSQGKDRQEFSLYL
jgi:hypothetical protein